MACNKPAEMPKCCDKQARKLCAKRCTAAVLGTRFVEQSNGPRNCVALKAFSFLGPCNIFTAEFDM
jgi:hypothetical protein